MTGVLRQHDLLLEKVDRLNQVRRMIFLPQPCQQQLRVTCRHWREKKAKKKQKNAVVVTETSVSALLPMKDTGTAGTERID